LCTAVLVLFCSSCATEPPQEQAPPPITFEPEPEKPKPIDVQPEEPKPVDTTPEKPKPVDTTPVEPKPQTPKPTPKPLDDSVVVAEIGEYEITRGQLKTDLIKALRGNPDRDKRVERVDPETVLLNMVREKAMVMEGRTRGLLSCGFSVAERNEKDLVNILVGREVAPKVKVTEPEIQAKMKSDPSMERAKAEQILLNTKGRTMVQEYSRKLKTELKFKKLEYNYPKAAQLYQRLLFKPQSKRSGNWVQGTQICKELTQEEKDIPLAKFDGGAITVEHWFRQIHAMPPLRRPKDLTTKQGVDKLVDSIAPMRLLVARAKALGLHKNPAYIDGARTGEDQYLLSMIRREAIVPNREPNNAEVKEYFEQNKEAFRKKDTLKIEQVWCEDIETAKKVKSLLDEGEDFETVREQHSLEKRKRPIMASVDTDGAFLNELWAAEPNDIVGPMKGFYDVRKGRRRSVEIKWRVVKILVKEPGAPREFNKSVAGEVKRIIRKIRSDAHRAKVADEYLKKFEHKMYPDRIKGIDPFEIP
jgi:hypothetical protein